MLATALFALLSLAAWRPVLKPVIVVLLFASALGAHFMWTYHVVIDAAMAANTLQTDWHEVQDLVTPRLGLVLLVGAAVPPGWCGTPRSTTAPGGSRPCAT